MIGYFLKIKFKTFSYVFFISFFILIIIYKEKFNLLSTRSSYMSINGKWEKSDESDPIILWWTPFLNNNELRSITCELERCTVTENRQYYDDSKITAFLFYGSSFNPYDLPLPRKSSHIWSIIHEESPKNLALFLHEDSHNIFNITSTFSRYSNFPLTLQYLPNLELLTGLNYFRTVQEKNDLLNNLSPVLYIQSDCTTPLERDSYVNELMEYIDIDSYGKCLNNKILPEKFTINPLEDVYAKDFMHFIAQYKFVIAFENAVCDDYITEKLWRPLIVGSVPIYLGSATVQDWLPNNNSAILVDNFDSPRELADYILKLNADDSLYNLHLDHKLNNKIDNNLLRKTIEERIWNIEDDANENHFFQKFECFICKQLHDNSFIYNRNGKRKAGNHIYNCPEPISPLTKKRNESNWWLNHWYEGKCQAHVLKQFLDKPNMKNYTKEMFDNETNRLILAKQC